MPPGTGSSADRLVWVPVRHHSPAAARAVIDLIDQHRPEAVLIEGPSDFTLFDQLLLDHRLPISILTWARYQDDDGQERQAHALYPLTEFSAEWQAIKHGAAAYADVEFIDLPWSHSHALMVGAAPETGDGADDPPPPDARADDGTDRAAALQHEQRPSRGFYRSLAGYVGREDLSAVWDEFFEIEPDLTTADYLRRAETVGAGLRVDAQRAAHHAGQPGGSERAGGPDDAENLARELHMARRIHGALARTTGPVLVVTGAFHTSGLRDLLALDPAQWPAAPVVPTLRGLVTGHALVPSSYRELDQDAGYLAGQPSPGFYHRIFAAGDTPAAARAVVEEMFTDVVVALRREQVHVSPADSIAAMSTARGLQQIRGHARLWRDDLLDGITSAVVKDDLDDDHPLVRVVRRVLSGDRTGRLAAGTDVPPLVTEVRRRWDDAELPRERREVIVTLDLHDPRDRNRSTLLHALTVLDVAAGHQSQPGGTGRTTSRTVISGREVWRVRWRVGCDTALTLASRWGGSLDAAVGAVLEHRALGGDPHTLAEVLVLSVRAGLRDVSGRLGDALAEVLATSGDLPALGGALGTLVQMVHFDTWLGTVGRDDLVALTTLCYDQCVAVLAKLPPQPAGADLDGLTAALRTLAETAVTLDPDLDLDVAALAAVVDAQAHAKPGRPTHAPEVRGALVGAGWLLSGDPAAALEARLADPEETGQFYVGLMAVAGHLAIAAPQIFDAADAALSGWEDTEFLASLPDFRRAMTALTNRERAALLRHLTGTPAVPPALEVDEASLLVLAAREAALWQSVVTHLGPLDAVRAERR